MSIGFESNEELRTIGASKGTGKSVAALQAIVRVGQTWKTKGPNVVVGAVFNHGVSASLDGKITSFEDLVQMLHHECGAELEPEQFHYATDYASIDNNITELELWYQDRWLDEAAVDKLKLDPHELPLVRWRR